MDTSDEYVKMCRAANEIQEGHKYNSGDFYMGCPYDDGYYSISGKISTYGSYDEFNMVPGYVWLPRQDQLQNIMFTTKDITAMHIIAWLNRGGIKYNSPSMEQTTLKLVMYTQYGKEWTREEWV